jgi:hypothetical protein
VDSAAESASAAVDLRSTGAGSSCSMQASDSVVSLRRCRQPAYEAGSWPARRQCKRPTDEDPSCGGSTVPLPYPGGHAHHAKLSSPGRASVAARRGRSSLLARRLRSATMAVGRGGLDMRRRAARARLVSSSPGASCLLRPQRQPMWIWRGICLAQVRLTWDPARRHFFLKEQEEPELLLKLN